MRLSHWFPLNVVLRASYMFKGLAQGFVPFLFKGNCMETIGNYKKTVGSYPFLKREHVGKL